MLSVEGMEPSGLVRVMALEKSSWLPLQSESEKEYLVSKPQLALVGIDLYLLSWDSSQCSTPSRCFILKPGVIINKH